MTPNPFRARPVANAQLRHVAGPSCAFVHPPCSSLDMDWVHFGSSSGSHGWASSIRGVGIHSALSRLSVTAPTACVLAFVLVHLRLFRLWGQ